MTHAERLSQMLRPAGGGIHTVSTGADAQREVQRRLYGDREPSDVWRDALARMGDAAVVVLGVPSDVGAGFARGASFGPQHIRLALLDGEGLDGEGLDGEGLDGVGLGGAESLYRDPRVVDLGDVRVVPQLLTDEMLSDAQIRSTRVALYGAELADAPWPVSPLSITREVLRIARSVAPNAVPLVLGGDHSVAWPVFDVVAEGRESSIGILHFDAHTDLMSERLGVEHCFATWAYHANERMGRGRRLVQVGIRASGHPRAHWERVCDVQQYWAADIEVTDPANLADAIVAHLADCGVEGVYISNDIDGTDPAHGAATGTPEPGGLHPDMVLTLIERVGEAFPICGSDLVEVAPPLAHERQGEPMLTLRTAARYVEAQLAASLRA